ncbi:eukaryotic translation initiation factor 4B2-like [Actinidia eriantha]|uniref:eukaryotic translation initiation factor 4B2-like n=1 Tax=Actinidia eriantha TaxID=165200 RepID=UPI0025859A27|nr:eukaryotic translation initiation factor 4B2-like [Actinidia eriantha]
MSKPWGNIGAWAAEAEQAEAEEREQAAAAASAGGGGGDPQSFPSLREAAAAKQQKKKKMSLQEFTMTGAASYGGGGHRGLTPDEMLRLPTGPKERSAEEMQYGRLGGGFSNYGRSGGGPPGRNGDGDSSWGGGGRRSYGGFDDDRRGPPPRRDSDFDQPSRADEADNWAIGKRASVPSVDSGRSGRYSSQGGGSMGMSKADEADNWGAMKKPIPSRSSNFGSGFGDSRPSSFGSGFGDSRPESDRWTRRGFGDGDRERPRLVLDPPRGEGGVSESVKTNKANPFGTARPREEVLAEKGLDWKKLEMGIEAKKTSRPTSSQSSRPSSAQSSRSEGAALQGTVEGAVVKPRLKLNPFGDAKPREVLLQEKGVDWRKVDLQLEHRGVDRPETEAEKNLKEEINHLKKELEKESSSHANRESLEGETQSSLNDLIGSKERDLELLIRELDDKVRFGQKGIERPGSGAGRVSSFPERPPSQSGAFEESRSMDFMERPRSRGTGDMWPRQGDDRRSFQGGRERGFLGNRDTDRPSSRNRW